MCKTHSRHFSNVVSLRKRAEHRWGNFWRVALPLFETVQKRMPLAPYCRCTSGYMTCALHLSICKVITYSGDLFAQVLVLRSEELSKGKNCLWPTPDILGICKCTLYRSTHSAQDGVSYQVSLQHFMSLVGLRGICCEPFTHSGSIIANLCLSVWHR